MLNMRKIPIALIIITIVRILLTFNESHFFDIKKRYADLHKYFLSLQIKKHCKHNGHSLIILSIQIHENQLFGVF